MRDPRTMVVLVCRGTEVAAWPLEGAAHPDLSVVDRLARLQVSARRLDCSIRLRHAPCELCGLLDLAGLTDDVIGREATIAPTEQ